MADNVGVEDNYGSVFPTEGFLRPRTQVRGFGRKLNASDVFFQVQFRCVFSV